MTSTVRSIAERQAFGKDGGMVELTALRAGREPDSKEHFGFNDGIGQPVIAGTGNLQHQLRRTGHATELAPGEFLLGYTNDYGIPSDSPMVAASRDPHGLLPLAGGPGGRAGAAADGSVSHDLGRNGSYLVFRQMAQDVAGFWQFLEQATREQTGESDPEARGRLAAKFVGRWPSGAPLVQHPHADPYAGTGQLTHANNFEYTARDPHGFACPLGAHIRRANPRELPRPRPADRAALHEAASPPAPRPLLREATGEPAGRRRRGARPPLPLPQQRHRAPV